MGQRTIPFHWRLARRERATLVQCPILFNDFRGPQMTQDKAQSAVNGCSLNKDCNTGLGHLWASLRARREAVICGVAFLGKGSPFPAERALQLTASRHADIIKQHGTLH